MNISVPEQHASRPTALSRLLAPTALATSLLFAASAQATALPDPDSTFDGIPVAVQYNDFYSYSGGLLHQWGLLSTGDYQGGGIGGLDLILGTGAAGQHNINVGPDGGFTFEGPMDFPSGATTTFDGRWGAGDQPQGPVLVDNLLSYLQVFDPLNTVPAFIFDLDQEFGDPNLFIRAEVYIWDPVSESKIAQWLLDDGEGGFVTTHGLIQVTGASGTTYFVNNLDSGRIDFLLFAETMDLSLYTGEGYWFVGEFEMAGLNGGFEELFLTGRFGPEVVPVLEPGSLALLGLGLVGLGWMRRQSRIAH